MYLGPKVFGNFRRKTPSRGHRQSRREGNSKAYLDKIRALPSCVSGKRPTCAHHLRHGDAARERGVGQKASDKWALPLTHNEHNMGSGCVHERGAKGEAEWFAERGIDDALALCRGLWERRKSLDEMRAYLREVTGI